MSLCPGVELKPQIKYNGSFKRGKLEKVFEAAARSSLKMGDEGQMGKLDRLQVGGRGGLEGGSGSVVP